MLTWFISFWKWSLKNGFEKCDSDGNTIIPLLEKNRGNLLNNNFRDIMIKRYEMIYTFVLDDDWNRGGFLRDGDLTTGL